MTRKWIFPAAAAILIVSAGISIAKKGTEKQKVREFTSVNIEYRGTKVWVPATFFAKKGEKIKIKLINETPSGKHGFAIDEFGVKTTVYNGKPETVEA